MPIHDWSKVEVSRFHNFHQLWIAELTNSLNEGILPAGYFAVTDQSVRGSVPDVVALQSPVARSTAASPGGGVAVAEAPPHARFVLSATFDDLYARRANRVKIQDDQDQVVAIIEIMSPGNKSSVVALRSFISKITNLIGDGINLLVVDLFGPTSRDPQGIHKQIWDEIRSEPFALPADKPFTVAAYSAGMIKRAYIEPVAVGDQLPSLPIFLDDSLYVPAPLEKTYQSTWMKLPAQIRDRVLKAGT